MNKKELMGMSGPELVGIYNALAEKPIKRWAKKKDILVDKILELAKDEKPQEPEVKEEAPAKSTRTIRAAAIAHLCEVAYHEDKTLKPGADNRVDASDKNARTVGIPYAEIIARIQEEFPNCETSVACLRWYGVKIRAGEKGYENLRMPQRRPRAIPSKG